MAACFSISSLGLRMEDNVIRVVLGCVWAWHLLHVCRYCETLGHTCTQLPQKSGPLNSSAFINAV